MSNNALHANRGLDAMKVLARVAVPAALTWALWLSLIAAEVLAGVPLAWLQWAFVASMPVAFLGMLWACSRSFASVTSRPRRVAAILGVSLAAFAVVVVMGHGIGVGFKHLIAGPL